MSWWIWILLGLALLAGEILTPGGFFLLFFGTSALLVGILVAIAPALPDWTQWLSFALLSVASLILFRNKLLQSAGVQDPGREVDALVGQSGQALEQIVPGGIGKVELRGSAWSALNTGSSVLAKGERCRVHSVQGLTLHVQEE